MPTLFSVSKCLLRALPGLLLALPAVANAQSAKLTVEDAVRMALVTDTSLAATRAHAVAADDIHHRAFYNFRALDYRYRFDNPLALALFGGAARYNLGTPAYGFTFGTGAQWRNLLPGWDLGLDYLYGIKVARLRVLPTDVQGGTRPDSFYDIDRVSLTLSRRF